MPEPRLEPARLRTQAAEVGVTLSQQQAQRLAEFGGLLLRWNQAFNLVSRRDTPRLIPRHLLDSLTVAPWLNGRRMLDLGTGAGLPGVPLAIAREDAHFTLIDLSERKIRFVRQVARTLGLENVFPRCGDVRAMIDEAPFDTVVCRAVSDPGTVWGWAAPRLAAAGRLVIMARAGGVEAPGEAPAPPPGSRLEGLHEVAIPGLGQAHQLLLLRHADSRGQQP